MKCAALALVVSVAGTTALAQDQAILACENIIKAELVAPKTYDAVSRFAAGNMVQITYDASNMYNTPIRATDKCLFVQKPDGWHLQRAYTEEAMRAEMTDLIKKIKSGEISKESAQSKLDDAERRYSSLVIDDATRIMRAKEAGPYPIPPNLTALR